MTYGNYAYCTVQSVDQDRCTPAVVDIYLLYFDMYDIDNVRHHYNYHYIHPMNPIRTI
jgi:hypothetical protein